MPVALVLEPPRVNRCFVPGNLSVSHTDDVILTSEVEPQYLAGISQSEDFGFHGLEFLRPVRFLGGHRSSGNVDTRRLELTYWSYVFDQP